MTIRKESIPGETAARNRRTLWRIVLAVALVWLIAGAVIGPSFVRKIGKFWLLDKCLDRGGCWDAQGSRCEMEDPSKCVQGGRSP